MSILKHRFPKITPKPPVLDSSLDLSISLSSPNLASTPQPEPKPRRCGLLLHHPNQRPYLALPHCSVQDIRTIDWDRLAFLGVRGVVFDKGNTLTAPYSPAAYPLIEEYLRRCCDMFPGWVTVFNNSAGLGRYDLDRPADRAVEEAVPTVHVISYNYHYMEGETMRVMYEPWFVVKKVDVVFSGHVHAYKRSERVSNTAYNITNCKCTPIKNPSAPVYITIGDGGNSEGLPNSMTEPQPSYSSAFREASFGHALFDIKNRTHALFNWHRNQDGNAVVADSMWFYNRLPSCC